MRKNGIRELRRGVSLLAAFAVWTMLVRYFDVRPMGVNGTDIGFSSLNVWFHSLSGVHMKLYTVTDWLGLVPILICLCFGCLGFVQLIGRKSLRLVDRDLVLLGVYYVLVIFAYLFFETIVINYRPVLINGMMEASYPSSTTLLVLSVMPTLPFQISRRSGNISVKAAAGAFAAVFSAFMVIGRLLSGVHWITDIIGSVLLSAGLFMLYRSAVITAERGKRRASAGEGKHGVS